jgi:hypothetical protein|tara:strand:+ start:375 stop:710 length:336 start_codon:yes stop_codon:yes gene_type:complete
MTTQVSFYIDQGIDFLLRLTVALDENTFEGITFYSSVRKTYSSVKLFDAEIVAEDAGGSNIDINIAISAAKTRDLKPGKYQYDVIYTTQDGIVKKLLEGIVYIIPTITRPE